MGCKEDPMTWQSLVPKVITTLRSNVDTMTAVDIEVDTELLGTGLLDSFGIVALIPALEDAFSTSIAIDDIEISVFETPASIAQYLEVAGRKP
jgi:acyl carrier protein